MTYSTEALLDPTHRSKRVVDSMTRRLDMVRAMREGRCYITPDGWCALHSTGAGAVFHDADTDPEATA